MAEELLDVKEKDADLELMMHGCLHVVNQCRPSVEGGGKAAHAKLHGVNQHVFVYGIEQLL